MKLFIQRNITPTVVLLLLVLVFGLLSSSALGQTMLRNGTVAMYGSMAASGLRLNVAVGQPLGGDGGRLQGGFLPMFQGVGIPTETENNTTVSDLPRKYNLNQNYPNPFNPTTRIAYELGESTAVQLTVFDILGREVAVLVDEFQAAGRHEVIFSPEGESTGVYVYRLRAGDQTISKRMILLK